MWNGTLVCEHFQLHNDVRVQRDVMQYSNEATAGLSLKMICNTMHIIIGRLVLGGTGELLCRRTH